MKKIKVFFAIIIVFLFALLCSSGLVAFAFSETSSDGTYSVPINLSGLAMGKNNFLSTSTVEKKGDVYYMSFGHSSSISDMRLISANKQTGYLVKTENDWTIYTYTLSLSRLKGSLSFSAFVKAMAKDVNFSISLNLEQATKVKDSIEDLGERPAEYVPVFSTTEEGNYQLSKGFKFNIPQISATLGNDECETTVRVYYIRDGQEESVDISDDCFVLEEVGLYRLSYKATYSSYKTSLDNDSYSVLNFTILSVAGGSSLAKVEDINEVLPSDITVITRYVTGGSVFELASSKMKKIADNFEVFNISLIDSSGSIVSLAENARFYLKAKSTFNRNKILVCELSDDGKLNQVPCQGYGKYVVFDSNHTGNFIVYVPGVAFVMPMWGYALICVAIVLLITGAIVAIIVIKKKKSRKPTLQA